MTQRVSVADKLLALFVLVVLIAAAVFTVTCELIGAEPEGRRAKGETAWVAEIANTLPHAAVEWRLPNGRRVDLVYDGYAVEADWAEGLKIFEAIGQALHYSDWMDRKPAVLLLVRRESEEAISDCKFTCAMHGIALWIFDTRDGTWIVPPPRLKEIGT